MAVSRATWSVQSQQLCLRKDMREFTQLDTVTWPPKYSWWPFLAAVQGRDILQSVDDRYGIITDDRCRLRKLQPIRDMSFLIATPRDLSNRGVVMSNLKFQLTIKLRLCEKLLKTLSSPTPLPRKRSFYSLPDLFHSFLNATFFFFCIVHKAPCKTISWTRSGANFRRRLENVMFMSAQFPIK